LEELEPREVFDVGLWTALGPMAQLNNPTLLNQQLAAAPLNVPQDEQMPVTGDFQGLISGRVTSVAFSPDIHGGNPVLDPLPVLFIGAAGGGIYRAQTNAAGELPANPTWVNVSPNSTTVQDSGGNLVSVENLAGLNRIGSLAVDPSNPLNIYAGTGDPVGMAGCGILRSKDGGNSWQLCGRTEFAGASVAKVVPVSTAAGTVLFAAVVPDGTANTLDGSRAGVWVSLDQGDTWACLNANFTGGNVSSILPYDLDYVTLKNGHIQMIAATSPVYGWGSGTVTYANANTGLWTCDIDPAAPLANIRTARWQKSLTGTAMDGAATRRIGLATVRDGSSQTVYAVSALWPAGLITDNRFGNLVSSADGGLTWTNRTPTTAQVPGAQAGTTNLSQLQTALGTQFEYDMTMAIRPGSPNDVILGGVDVVRFVIVDPPAPQPPMVLSQSAVAPTQANPGWKTIDSGNPWPVHGDHHALLWTSPTIAYDGNDGGIWKIKDTPTTPLGVTWTDLNTNQLNTIQVDGVGAYKFGTTTAYVEASQDNGVARLADPVNGVAAASKQWVKTFFPVGDGGPVLFSGLGWGYLWRNGGTPMLLYSPPRSQGLWWKTFLQQPGNNTGKDGFPLDYPQAEKFNSRAPLATTSDGSLQVIASSNSIWERRNVSWVRISAGAPWLGTTVTITSVAFADNSTIYVGTAQGRVYKTVNSGGNWIDISSTAPWVKTAPVTSITVDPGSIAAPHAIVPTPANNVVYITFGAGAQAGQTVYRSTDGGTSWRALAGLPATPVYKLAIDTGSLQFNNPKNRSIYVATDLGVYQLQSNNWTRFGTTLPVTQVTALQVLGNKLIAGTYGFGVWSTDLDRTPPGMSAIEGQNATAIVLGSFSDPGSDRNYTVTVDFGDGQTGSGTVTFDGSTYTASTSGHVWQEAGPYEVTATVTGDDGFTQTFTLDLEVADAQLSATPQSLTAAAEVPFSGVQLTTFSDADPFASATDFVTTIDWGDGTTGQGTVTLQNGVFQVLGDHTYTNAGTFSVNIGIFDQDGAATTLTETALVSGPVSLTPATIAPTEGTPWTGTVATFTAPPGATYAVILDWGDGTTQTLSVTSGTNTYNVAGSHLFARDGQYVVGVTVQDGNQNTLAQVASPVTVAEAPLTGTGVALSGVVGALPPSSVVATFSDANPLASAADFYAVLYWGDGTTSTGTILPDGNGGFTVSGQLPYQTPGTFVVTVSINELDPSAGEPTADALDLTSSAVVAAAPPVVAGISPASGLVDGGTAVTITGSNLASATAVLFGTVSASFTSNPDGTLTAIAPPSTPGSVDVTVVTASGTSATSSADTFTYLPDPPPAPATLAAEVWFDSNGNGLLDPGENGLAGIAVTLVSMTNGASISTFTNASGEYQFATVAPGDYYLHFDLPAGLAFTQQIPGGGPDSSTVDPLTGNTAVFTLLPGEIDLWHNAGVIPVG
jgi:hypothetical protein